MNSHRLGMRSFIALALSSIACALPASAQSYPNRPVRLIVPSPPGGVSDISARLIGEHLTKLWGHQVLVENRPGAGGNIGIQAAASAAADGYTLYGTTNSQTSIDPVVDPALVNQMQPFVPVIKVASNPIIIVANAGEPFNDLAGLAAASRANPGKYAYATAGVASVPHLAAEWLTSSAGIKLRHIPFKGGAPSAAAVASGELPLASIAYSSAIPFVKSGKVKPITVTAQKPISMVPEWKTARDAGYTDVDIVVWTGVFALKGTPAEIVRKVAVDIKRGLDDPELRGRFEGVGAVVDAVAQDDFSKQIEVETTNIRRIVKQADIRIR